MHTSVRYSIALTLAGVAAMIAACGGDNSSPATVSTPTVVVSAISVSGTAPAVGMSAQFSAIATLSNRSGSGVTAQATWSSSNAAIATVSNSGIVSALAAGEADITATYQGVGGSLHVTIAKPDASTYTIAGTVTDEFSGGVLPNINVQATDSRQNSFSSKTDNTGSYSLSGLAAGPVTVVASGVSYQTTQRTASISANTRVDIVVPRVVCAFTLSATRLSFQSSGGTGTVSVSTQATGCVWTAKSNDAFITVGAGSSGIDNGTVTFSVAAGAVSRTGTLTIAGQTVFVNQVGPECTYVVSPTSIRFLFGFGGTSTVTVTAPSQCAWTAVSNASFVTVTGGASGLGNGSVTITVPGVGNEPVNRTGTLTVAGQTVTVNHVNINNFCDLMTFPDHIDVPVYGGTFSFDVYAPSTCEWSAEASDFVTITAVRTASFGYPGTVTFTVAPNPTGVERRGQVTLRGGNPFGGLIIQSGR